MFRLSGVLGPNIQSVSILDTINKSAPVLRPINVNLVAITSLLVHVPVTTVASLLLSIDLNTKSMSHHHNISLMCLLKLGNILHNQIVAN